MSYLRKNTHLRKDPAFSHFYLKESSKSIIFLWNRNKIWSLPSFSEIFVRQKTLFFHGVKKQEKEKKKWKKCKNIFQIVKNSSQKNLNEGTTASNNNLKVPINLSTTTCSKNKKLLLKFFINCNCKFTKDFPRSYLAC